MSNRPFANSSIEVYWVLFVWVLLFTTFVTTGLCQEYGPCGVVYGMTSTTSYLPTQSVPTSNGRLVRLVFADKQIGALVAVFQAAMYGGFSGGAGFLSTLVSVIALGCISPVATSVAVVLATFPAWILFCYD